ncbi:hypothetical protein JXO52_12300 [bacterium]|nr:hypothetical protein [bacterium]
MKTSKRIQRLILSVLLLMSINAYSQHFIPVYTNNPYQPMNIFVVAATIDAVDLVSGDEIGVFDGSLCVGVGTIGGTLTFQAPLQINAGKDDESGNGFTEGNTIIFKLWDQSEGVEVTAAAQFYDTQTGDPIDPVAFTGLGQAAVGLTYITPNTPPVVTDISPVSGQFKDTISLTAVSSDADPGDSVEKIKYEYSLDGSTGWTVVGEDDTPGTEYTWTSGLNEATVWIRAAAYDGDVWGEWFTGSGSFIIDNTPPVFSNWGLNPADIDNQTVGAVTVTLDIADNLTGISLNIPQFAYKIGTDTYTTPANMTQGSGDTWSFAIPEPTGGWSARSGEILYYSVTSIDDVENEQSEEKTELIDISSNPGLIAHYSLDGNALDVSGNGNNGTESPGITYSFDSFRGTCLDGVRHVYPAVSYIATPLTSGFAVSSVAIWFMTRPDSGGTLFSNHKEYDNEGNFFVYFNRLDSTLEVKAITEAGFNPNITSSSTFEPNQWHHAVLVNDNAEHSLYVDGVLEGFFAGNSITDTYPLVIGSDNGDYTYNYFGFGGLLSDARVYNYALTLPEIEALASERPELSVAVPNGEETWIVGSTQTISWTTSSASGNVKIEYSIDNAATWSEIVASTPDLGTYDWTVPNTPTTECLVKISDVTGAPIDQSDMAFSIYSDSFDGDLGVFLDSRDATCYNWVRIGNQIWMAENLKADKYLNGDNIPNVETDAVWPGVTDGATCIYGNTAANSETYGLLYNWFAVNDDRGLAPDGWHVPTDAEWMELEVTLGMSSAAADDDGYRGTDEGGKLKDNSELFWNSPNEGATNESQFTALPAGGRNYSNGSFMDLSIYAHFWTATEASDDRYAWRRRLAYDRADIYRTTVDKPYGFSVRCIKNLAVDELNIVSPNGGETLEVGTSYEIAWNSSGTSGDVKIEYSIDNGITWTEEAASTPDDGTYTWTVPGTPSTECLVKVSDLDGTPVDQSDSVFFITSVRLKV